MWLFVVEALAAAGILIFMVWWTMFSGRKNGEPPRDETEVSKDSAEQREP